MFSEQLIRALEEFHLLKHPFYKAWMNGEVTHEQMQNYAIQYYPHVLAFPRYVSAVHSRCDDLQSRIELAHNLADEEGLTGGEPHPELWLQFAKGFRVSREQVERASIKPAAQNLVDGFFQYTQASYAEGLASLFAYEYQVPEISKTKIEGLKMHYGISEEAVLKFFQVHEQADVYHSEACKEALNRLPTEEQEKALQAAISSGRLLWNFLSEAYESA